MITPLRRRHRWLAPSACALAGTVLLTGLMARPSEFIAGARGGDGSSLRVPSSPQEPSGLVRRLDGRLGVSVTRSEGDVTGAFDVELIPLDALRAADVLAYAAGEPASGGALPADAMLLGTIHPVDRTRLEVPAGRTTLVLYSLAERTIVESIDLSRLTEDR